MHLILNLVCWVCLIWSYGLMLSDEIRNDEDWDRSSYDWDSKDWDRMLPPLARLCPKLEYCGKTVIDDVNVTYPDNSCCHGCSCDRNCSESRDCCWGDDDDSLTTCLQPSTGKDDLLLNSYSFVSEPPTDGCKQVQGHKGHAPVECETVQSLDEEVRVTCSPDEMVAPWGNFSPVYSRSLDKNFKNAACARCHGARDIECWPSVLHSDVPVDFEGLFADFNEKNVLINSNIVFSPPNKDSSSFNNLCFIEIESCSHKVLDRFYIPSFIKMDRESIVNACEKGPRSIYLERAGRVFRNVFCAICNGFTNRYIDRLRCETSLDDSRIKSPPIRILLDAVYLSSIKRMKSQINNQKNVHPECFKPEHSMDGRICKELYCPSLQTRLQTGQCGYAAKIASIEPLAVCLNVSSEDDLEHVHGDVMNMTGTKIVSLLDDNSPWSKTYWKIFAVGVRIVERKGLEFLVCLTWKKQKLNFETLNKQIKTSLHEGWPMNFTRKIKFDQTISEHGRITSAFDYNEYMHTIWENYITPKTGNLVPPLWKRLYLADAKILYEAFYVGKMFLCEQIELSPHEYELELPGGVLYVTTTRGFLYPGQYTHLRDDGVSWRVRVCLSDADGYVKVVNGTGTRMAKFDHLLLSFSLFVYLLIEMF